MEKELSHLLIDNSHAGIAIIDDNFRLTYVNKKLNDILNLSSNELIGMDFRELLDPLTAQKLGELYLRRQKGEEIPGSYEMNIKTKRGLHKHVIINTSIIEDSKGEHYSVAQILDITKRYQSELELKKSEQQYRTVVENANDAIFIILNNKIVYANKPTFRLLGYTEVELYDTGIKELVYDEDYPQFITKTVKRKETDDERLYKTIRFVTRQAKICWVQLSQVPIEFDGQIAVLNFGRDITQERVLEERLRLAQRMEAIGTLAGGIAHDFNNILSPIFGYTMLALDEVPEDSPVCEYLNHVLTAANRAKELVGQILAFSREGENVPAPIKVQIAVKEALKLLRASIPATITINTDIEKDCKPVLGDPTQIFQIMMNLCTNAYQAMQQIGGVLTVSLSEKEICEEDIYYKPDLKKGAYCLLSVSDTGQGMDKQVQQRIFEPFFTTRKNDQGTGMGLFVVHGIIKNIGGYIDVYSEPGKGTTITVYLPCADSKLSESVAVPIDDIPTGTEKVLFIDDEEIICNMVKQLLGTLGYRVSVFSNAVKAVKHFKKNPQKYDLVITDQVMPGLTGSQIAQNIAAVRSDIPVIVCTGFAEQMEAKVPLIKALVKKPILKQDLAYTIRKVLDKQ